MKRNPKASLFHACPHTSNMGVSALFASVISGLHRRLPGLEMSVFDTMQGNRLLKYQVDDQEPIELRVIGYRTGRRFHRPENLQAMRVAAKLGPVGRFLNPGVRAISDADVVLDVSGGDSFTDMYPDRRINYMSGCKELVISTGKPLVLLPQTYGPFDKSMDRAKKIVRAAFACYARDERSFETLKSMLGSEFDPDRHKCGVDMAFGLASRDPGSKLGSSLRSWIEEPAGITIGFNVSGLIGNSPGLDRSKYGFLSDYRSTLEQTFRKLLGGTDARVILIPHVMGKSGLESDWALSDWLMKQLEEDFPGRVVISPIHLDQCEVKWLISRVDWFCGTRMHSTIASLSSGVPTATISYSDKATGVFETCGQGNEVFDPRVLESTDIVEGVVDSFRRREEIKVDLGSHIDGVKKQAVLQMDEIAAMVEDLGSRRRPE